MLISSSSHLASYTDITAWDRTSDLSPISSITSVSNGGFWPKEQENMDPVNSLNHLFTPLNPLGTRLQTDEQLAMFGCSPPPSASHASFFDHGIPATPLRHSLSHIYCQSAQLRFGGVGDCSSSRAYRGEDWDADESSDESQQDLSYKFIENFSSRIALVHLYDEQIKDTTSHSTLQRNPMFGDLPPASSPAPYYPPDSEFAGAFNDNM